MLTDQSFNLSYKRLAPTYVKLSFYFFNLKRIYMNTIDRENCILSSFLYADDMGMNKDEAFVLNESIFTSSYRRATASKINDETNNDKYYGYLSVTLQEHTKDTRFEQDWTDIISQTPLPFSVVKRIHSDLAMEYKNRISKGLR